MKIRILLNNYVVNSLFRLVEATLTPATACINLKFDMHDSCNCVSDYQDLERRGEGFSLIKAGLVPGLVRVCRLHDATVNVSGHVAATH